MKPDISLLTKDKGFNYAHKYNYELILSFDFLPKKGLDLVVAFIFYK